MIGDQVVRHHQGTPYFDCGAIVKISTFNSQWSLSLHPTYPITTTDGKVSKEPPLTVTGLKNIDCMVKDALKVYLAAKPTPKSDVLATYEIEYSAQDEGGEKFSKIRTVHIGM